MWCKEVSCKWCRSACILAAIPPRSPRVVMSTLRRLKVPLLRNPLATNRPGDEGATAETLVPVTKGSAIGLKTCPAPHLVLVSSMDMLRAPSNRELPQASGGLRTSTRGSVRLEGVCLRAHPSASDTLCHTCQAPIISHHYCLTLLLHATIRQAVSCMKEWFHGPDSGFMHQGPCSTQRNRPPRYLCPTPASVP